MKNIIIINFTNQILSFNNQSNIEQYPNFENLKITNQQSCYVITKSLSDIPDPGYATKIIDQNREHPAVWKNRVTTPAGTTAAGLFELEQGKFRSIINAAVIAATERAQELAHA